MALAKRTDDKEDKLGLYPNSNKSATSAAALGANVGTNLVANLGTNLGIQTSTPTVSIPHSPGFNYGGYRESQAVTDARNAMNAHSANQVADWTGGTYGDALKQAMDRIANREKFSYDLNGDALYQQYKDQYINQGRLAMQDTIGQASAMTGGYGNSYAATAGNQAYQGYLQSLNNVVPELYQLAYDKYNREGEDLYNQYSMYNNAYNTDYGQYRDQVSDWYTEYDRLSNAYNNAYAMDYGQYSDSYDRAFARYKQKVAEEQYAKDLAFKQAQAEETIRIARQKALYDQRQKDDGDDGNTEKTEKNQYESWGASEWQQYFASIRNSEGTDAAEKELQEFTRKGYIPKNMTSYAAIGARGSLGH